MSIKIGIADLVANALIELVDNNENNREVTYKQLNEYGALVIEKLNAQKDEARGYLSLDMLLAFISEYFAPFT